MCFAFTAFWGYLTFGQYLVIWYGNLGEETFFMHLRLISPWKWVTVASVVLVFFAPFFGLLSRAAKVSRPWMTLFALCSLVGMWLMRYIEVFPSTYGVVTRAAVRDLGDWLLAAVRRRVGLVLHEVRRCLPENARDADHVAVPRRGAGAGESGDDGAAAGARVVIADVSCRYSSAFVLLHSRRQMGISGIGGVHASGNVKSVSKVNQVGLSSPVTRRRLSHARTDQSATRSGATFRRS